MRGLFRRADPSLPTARQLTAHVNQQLGEAKTMPEATAEAMLQPCLAMVAQAMSSKGASFSRNGDRYCAKIWGDLPKQVYDRNKTTFRDARRTTVGYNEQVESSLQSMLEKALVTEEAGYASVSAQVIPRSRQVEDGSMDRWLRVGVRLEWTGQ